MADGAGGLDRVIAGERPALERSLWAATANPAPETPPLRGDAAAPVAVVGAGFTGLSAALHLAERGIAAHVLEAHSPGWGASGRNGGQVIAGLKLDPDALLARYGPVFGPRVIALAGGAPDRVFDLIRRHGVDCDAEPTGWMQPAHDAASHEVQKRRVAAWRAYGDPMTLLDAAEMERRLGAGGHVGGLHDARGGGLHPLNYALGLARAALAAGARISGDSPVTGLSRRGRDWVLETPGGRLTAPLVILATNGYSGPTQDVLRRSLIPACSVQVATAPLSENIRRSIMPGREVASDTRRLLLYYRVTRDGRFMIGGRGAMDDGGIVARQEQLRRAARRMFPQLGDAEWPMRWGGYVAITADHLPHLQRLADGMVTGYGYNGRGVAMATAMGRVLADLASGTPDAALDFPVTPTKPIPLHFLRRQIVYAVSAWYAARDRIG